jgi:putative serine protease PepD
MMTADRAKLRLPIAILAIAIIAALVIYDATRDDPRPSPAPADVTAVQTQFNDVVSRVSPQVVQIRTTRGLGSGVVYDTAGHIVTNAHVAGSSKQFEVTLMNGDKRSGKLVATDPSNDLAIVQVSGDGLTPAEFADSSKLQGGDIVFAIGNPLGLQSSVTQGIVSSLNRSIPEGDGVTLGNVIQTSAEINPGNSGGALVDLSGRVVGIPTLAALDPEFGGTPAAGIGFAIASNTVDRVASGLIATRGVSASR